MKHGVRIITALAGAGLLSGCIARTAVDIVTAPVKIVSKGVDLATTSQSEADEKRGREMRKREERLGALERQYEREWGKCGRGDANACTKADSLSREIAALMPTVPVPAD